MPESVLIPNSSRSNSDRCPTSGSPTNLAHGIGIYRLAIRDSLGCSDPVNIGIRFAMTVADSWDRRVDNSDRVARIDWTAGLNLRIVIDPNLIGSPFFELVLSTDGIESNFLATNQT